MKAASGALSATDFLEFSDWSLSGLKTLFLSIRRRKGVSSLVEEEETPFRGRLYVGIGPAGLPP